MISVLKRLEAEFTRNNCTSYCRNMVARVTLFWTTSPAVGAKQDRHAPVGVYVCLVHKREVHIERGRHGGKDKVISGGKRSVGPGGVLTEVKLREGDQSDDGVNGVKVVLLL